MYQIPRDCALKSEVSLMDCLLPGLCLLISIINKMSHQFLLHKQGYAETFENNIFLDLQLI